MKELKMTKNKENLSSPYDLNSLAEERERNKHPLRVKQESDSSPYTLSLETSIWEHFLEPERGGYGR
jgi:hypothetical protein